jgi:hypothetical protein
MLWCELSWLNHIKYTVLCNEHERSSFDSTQNDSKRGYVWVSIAMWIFANVQQNTACWQCESWQRTLLKKIVYCAPFCLSL